MGNRIYSVNRGAAKATVGASSAEADVAAAITAVALVATNTETAKGTATTAKANTALAVTAATTVATNTETSKTSATSADNAAATGVTNSTAADDAAAVHQGALKTDVAAAVAVLVADGATPTQAHVNTLNTAWGLLSTAMTSTKTATATAKTTDASTKTATATAKTDATTADTNADLAVTAVTLGDTSANTAKTDVTTAGTNADLAVTALGVVPADIAFGAALIVDDSLDMSKNDVYLALEAMQRAVLEDKSYPGA